MRKYVLIPDSFKGTMSSLDVCRIVTDAILSQEPDAAVCAIPVADGGEGTVDAFLSAVGGQRIPVNCTGPMVSPSPPATAFCRTAPPWWRWPRRQAFPWWASTAMRSGPPPTA